MAAKEIFNVLKLPAVLSIERFSRGNLEMISLKLKNESILDGLTLNTTEIIVLSVGTLTAFFVSLFVIKFLMAFVKNHSFESFGWYRIILGIILVTYYVIKISI